jgi:hypothetical protein
MAAHGAYLATFGSNHDRTAEARALLNRTYGA